MGVPTSEVGYNSATARRRDHESSYEHVVALEEKKMLSALQTGRLQSRLGHGAAGRIMSIQNPNDPIGNRACDFPACSAV